MNLCNPVFWSFAKLVSEDPHKSNVDFVLVGTAGLAVHGYDVEHSDLDFLCRTMPDIAKWQKEASLPDIKELEPKYCDSSCSSLELEFGEKDARVECNLIFADNCRIKFFPSSPVDVEGVPVATVDDILGLKRMANRPKDLEFFKKYRSLFEAS